MGDQGEGGLGQPARGWERALERGEDVLRHQAKQLVAPGQGGHHCQGAVWRTGLPVCFEVHFSKKTAYAFLDDLAQEFHNQYGHKINTATRPYSFIEFDTYIQKAKKTYSDSRGRRNLNNLNTELQDVQRIMVQNIDDVLQRGAVLSELEN